MADSGGSGYLRHFSGRSIGQMSVMLGILLGIGGYTFLGMERSPSARSIASMDQRSAQ